MTARSAVLLMLATGTLAALPPMVGCALRQALPGDDDKDNRRGGHSVAPNGRGFTEDELSAKTDVVGYARYCKQELGLPETTLAPWNCLDGTEIPVTVEGKPPTAEDYENLKAHKIGCDLPAWLAEEPCANYAFAQKRQLAPNVEAVLICRMRTFGTVDGPTARREKLAKEPSLESFLSYYAFDSLGLIWTNTETGKTCFFDVIGKTYGGYVASPDDDRSPEIEDLPEPRPHPAIGADTEHVAFWQRDARQTWRPPAEVESADNCVRCHDSGPYKASPWIEQTFDVPANPQNAPYIVVGSVFDPWRKRFPMRSISTGPIESTSGDQEPQICTSCHRIGAHATCDDYVEYSTGKTSPAPLTERGATFFYRTWMPPPPAAWHGKTESELTTLWTDAYERHVARLKCCCQTPDARGCVTQDFSTSPISKPVASQGPGVCP